MMKRGDWIFSMATQATFDKKTAPSYKPFFEKFLQHFLTEIWDGKI